LLSSAVLLVVACDPRPEEFGVSVFANDTLPVRFEMEMLGGLEIGIRASGFTPGRNRTLIMTTPAQLLVQRGEGTAIIRSLAGGAMIVQPIGIKPDSGDTSSALGTEVKLVRAGTQRSVKLTVEKP
jgi:hypothetical protein